MRRSEGDQTIMLPDGRSTLSATDSEPVPFRFLLLVVAIAGIFFIITSDATAQMKQADRASLTHLVVMKSGDSFRGRVVRQNDTTLVIQTEFNQVELPKSAISELVPLSGRYLHPPHHFLMPTASPNGPGGFISNYELGFFYGGFGIGNSATITMGMTTVPGISISSQLFHVGAKFTVEQSDLVELALGATYTFFTLREPYAHLYAVATSPLGNGRWSAMLLYKVSGDERAPIELYGFGEFDTTRFTLYYEGSIGAALGIDGPVFGRDDMSFFAEIWNNDLQRPGNTVSAFGIRLHNEVLSADFGAALLPLPAIAPVFSFRWNL